MLLQSISQLSISQSIASLPTNWLPPLPKVKPLLLEVFEVFVLNPIKICLEACETYLKGFREVPENSQVPEDFQGDLAAYELIKNTKKKTDPITKAYCKQESANSPTNNLSKQEKQEILTQLKEQTGIVLFNKKAYEIKEVIADPLLGEILLKPVTFKLQSAIYEFKNAIAAINFLLKLKCYRVPYPQTEFKSVDLAAEIVMFSGKGIYHEQLIKALQSKYELNSINAALIQLQIDGVIVEYPGLFYKTPIF